MKKAGFIALIVLATAGCNKPSRVEQYKAEKRVQDSVRLEEQIRSMAYYEGRLEEMMPTADSLMALFTYERNEKYQDHGYYVVKPSAVGWAYSGLRVMVRDDGRDLLVYQDGKRLTNERVNELGNGGNKAIALAEELQVTISDIKELEKRIGRTSLEIQKYQKRLQKQ